MRKLINICTLTTMMMFLLACTTATNKNGSFGRSPSYHPDNSATKEITKTLEKYDHY